MLTTTNRPKSVLVTGGTKGIGKGIARVFAERGARVSILGRNEHDGTATIQALQGSKGEVSFFRCDVRNHAEMRTVAAEVASASGGIDILCANAGVAPTAPLQGMSERDWDEVSSTNVKGMISSVTACLPYLKQSPAGRIVLTSSITGPLTGYPGLSLYGATKAAMLGFMRSAAIELAKSKVTINAVLPGSVRTEGLLALGEPFLDRMAASIPLGRLASVEEIGHAVAFLASDEAGYITGQTLVIDGGQTLPEFLQALEE